MTYTDTFGDGVPRHRDALRHPMIRDSLRTSFRHERAFQQLTVPGFVRVVKYP